MKSALGCIGTALCLALPLSAHGQTAAAPRPAYYLADFELTHPDAIKPYSAQVAATFAPFGGRYLVRGGTQTLLEGEASGGRLVIIAFDSAAQARAWYDSPAYARLKPIRQAAGKSRVLLVDGLPGAMPAPTVR